MGTLIMTASHNLTPLDDAVAQLLATTLPLTETETVSLDAAAGRVLRAPVRAETALPAFDNVAMDGYAVRHADVAAGAPLPVAGRVPAGQVTVPALPEGTALRVFTGAMLPAGADTVVVQERCTEENGRVHIPTDITPGGNIRRAGDDVAAGREVLSPRRRLTPRDCALAAALGVTRLTVSRPARVALFSSGDELRAPGTPLDPGTLYDSNRPLLRQLLSTLGVEVTDLGILPDDLSILRDHLQRAAVTHDMILTTGGVSVGEEDHLKAAMNAVGELDLWRLTIKPGKPLATGRIGDTRVLGLPGNPVAVLVTFLMVARPVLLRIMGCDPVPEPHWQAVPMGFHLDRRPGRREFLRAVLVPGPGGFLTALPAGGQGSHQLGSLANADGLVDIAADRDQVLEGEEVPYLSFAEVMA